MSWTNRKLEKQAEKIFDKGVLKASGNEGGSFFPLSADPSAASYFRERQTRRMSPEDFVLPACSGDGDLTEALRRQWSDAPALSAVAMEMASLADGLREEGQEQTDEVSPFIYVMF